jgi:peptidoglycan/LPS O-acetylase OafA/YrhL
MRRQPVRTVAMIAKKAWYVFVPRLVPYYRLGPDTTIALFDDGRFTVANASPRPLSHQWVYSASYVFVIVAAALGIYVRRTRLLQSDAVLWLIVLSFVAVYAVYFPSTGYLTPIAFVWLFYASVGLTQSRRPRGSPLGPAAARRSGADT